MGKVRAGYFGWALLGCLTVVVLRHVRDPSASIWVTVLSSALTLPVVWLLWRSVWWERARAAVANWRANWETVVAEAEAQANWWAEAEAQRAAAKAKNAEQKAARQTERKEARARRELEREQERRRREVERERAEAAWKQEQEKKRAKRLEERKRKEAVASELSEIASTSFLVRSCPSCYENTMYLLSVSPNGRSIQYQCVTCNKRQRAAAASPRAQEAVGLIKEFGRHHPYKLAFTTPLDPLPYEQTVREPIPDAMRSQVWRRDGGQCVKCGGKANLQLDHIIPVKKGGATTVNNLQLLCRSCNLAKGAKI